MLKHHVLEATWQQKHGEEREKALTRIGELLEQIAAFYTEFPKLLQPYVGMHQRTLWFGKHLYNRPQTTAERKISAAAGINSGGARLRHPLNGQHHCDYTGREPAPAKPLESDLFITA
jgi:hypothetical protein